MTTEKDKYVSSIKRYFDIHFKVLENSIAELNSKFININLINSELDEINKEISTLNNKQNELVVSLNEQIKQMPLETKQMYRQIECFYYLNRKLNLNNHLPCLRGWVASPDILLFLHDFIIKHKPVTILEFGSGVSTLVIASALRQNGSGKLYSIDHDADFAKKTSELISNEKLNKFVDLRVGSLIQWEKAHMNNSNQEVLWYNIDSISDIENIDLLFVDGPPKELVGIPGIQLLQLFIKSCLMVALF